MVNFFVWLFLCIDVAMCDPVHDIDTTVKLLNFWTPENFAVIYLKFKKRGQTFGYFVKKMQMEKQTVETLIRLLL